ncbi:MAG: mitofilin family membrane protein [Boseongicola sp.]|nr:mitofilin family membrane protein [Boseongicola sp.]
MADPEIPTKISDEPGASGEPEPDPASQEPSDAAAATGGGAADAGLGDAQAERPSALRRTAGSFFGADRTRLSIASGLVGGLAAGAVGFLVAVSLPQLTGQSDKAEQALSAVEAVVAEMSVLKAQLIELRGLMQPPPDLSGLEDGIAALEDKVSELGPEIGEMEATTSGKLSELGARLAALFGHVEALEASSGDVSLSQAVQTEEQLTRFRGQLDQLVADAEARIADAEAKIAGFETSALEAGGASAAGNRFAIARLRAAVETGAPYSDVISTMEGVPPELADHARTGIPTLHALRQEFPSAARAALAASRSISGEGTVGDRIVTFLRHATNARSLTPREGDSADAILSRAEAHVAEGDLPAALAELDSLPGAPRAAIAGWVAKAEFRLAVLGAIDVLAGGMN